MNFKLLALLVLLGAAPAASSVWAADVAFIYATEEIVRSGKPIFGSVVAEGVLAPADAVLAAGGEVFVGLPDESVKKASLVRLDKDLNVALLRLGERVLNPEMQKAHRLRALQLQTFLPTQAVLLSSATDITADLGEVLVSSGAPLFKITFNGSPVSNNVVHFKAFLKKMKFSVGLEAINPEPRSGFSFRVHANPKLEFKSLESSISRTAMPGYAYEFKSTAQFNDGKKFVFPLEARGISLKDYEWIIEVKSGDHIQQEKVFVHFD